MHMAEPDRQLGRGPVGGKLDLEDGRTQDFETLRQRLAVEAERLAIVFALVEGLVGIRVMGAPDAAKQPDRFRRRQRDRLLRTRRRLEPAARQIERPPLDRCRWPARLRHPAARNLLVKRRRTIALLHPDPEHGLIHDPGLDPLQPFVPPAQGFLEKTDGRAGHADRRVLMRPRPDQPLARRLQMLEQPRDRISIAVDPATDRVDRALDRGIVLADRSVLPVSIASLVAQPFRWKQR